MVGPLAATATPTGDGSAADSRSLLAQQYSPLTTTAGIDPMGPPAQTMEGLRKQVSELEQAHRELQSTSQETISQNVQQLSVLHHRIQELRTRLAASQRQPAPSNEPLEPPPPPPFPVFTKAPSLCVS